MIRLLKKGEGRPICRFGWQPSSECSVHGITRELGVQPTMTEEDKRRQILFYDEVFANPNSSVSLESSPDLRQLLVPHLFTFKYPWNPLQSVTLFGVVMKYEYHIIAIGPPARPSAAGQPKAPDIIRVLYVGAIKASPEDKERIEIYHSSPNYILYISEDGRLGHGFSGAPLPMPRCTIITPHFLEEDPCYDTFIIKEAALSLWP